MAEDPFAVLGVGEDATNKQVESAFRRLALRCHPDRHPKDPLAKARFLRLSRAKEVLLDAAKRRAAQSKHRNTGPHRGGTASRSQPQSRGSCQARNAAADAATKKRRAAAEQLRKREEEAKERRRRAKEASEAKRRCDELAAKKEAEAREVAASRERRKVELFEAFLRKKQAKPTTPAKDLAPPMFIALLNRFASSSEQRLTVPGPLSPAEHMELMAIASRHGFIVIQKSRSVELERPLEPSGSESPWEPPEGTFADRKVRRLRKRTASSSATDAAERQREALERLQVRRANGEGLTNTPQGSWWVHDKEAERYAKYIDFCGF